MTTLAQALAQKLRYAGIRAYVLNASEDNGPTVTVTPYMGEVIGADQAVVGDVARIQFYTRGSPRDYESAETLAWRAYNEILRIQETAEPVEGYRSGQPLQSPTYIGIDEKDRHMLSFNVPYRRIAGSP